MTEYEFATGSIYIEIPLMLSSDSGRAKHTDLNEQGAHLAVAVGQFLKKSEFYGAALTEIRYWGEIKPGNQGAPRVFTFDNDL